MVFVGSVEDGSKWIKNHWTNVGSFFSNGAAKEMFDQISKNTSLTYFPKN